jgi:hypothetical protein
VSGAQGNPGGRGAGVFSQPATLAAFAAGLASAVLALWAMRGLPLGTLLLWLVPLPLFAAGFAFGAVASVAAGVVGTGLLLLLSNGFGMALYAAVFALPAALLVSASQAGIAPGGRLELSLPLALLGIWPVVLLMGLALAVDDLEGAMREAVSMGVRRMGIGMPDGMMEQVVRVKAAAAGFWLALVMLGNGTGGYTIVARQGLARHMAPDWTEVALPRWYAALPLAAGLAWAVLGGAVALSALLILLVPVFLLGVAGVHRRLRGRSGRVAFLAGFYVLMFLFLQIMAPLLVGVGLLDQWRRRLPPTT